MRSAEKEWCLPTENYLGSLARESIWLLITFLTRLSEKVAVRQRLALLHVQSAGMGAVVLFAVLLAVTGPAMGASPLALDEQVPSSVASSMDASFAALQTADALLASMVTGSSRTCPADCVTYFDGCGDCVCANGPASPCVSS